MKTIKQPVHFTDNYLLNPTNPIMVNLIGCGGTGSQVLTCLARINNALLALNHAGLMVRVYDDDIVTEANLGRQLFAGAEIGVNKAVALLNRLNRFFGTAWKAVPHRFGKNTLTLPATITISCVDTSAARFEIAEILRGQAQTRNNRDTPVYWIDFGNSRHTGQVVLATVGTVVQPKSKRYKPVSMLPFITDEFKTLLDEADTDDTPSCSLAEALTKQDLFINSTLAQTGSALLWHLFSEGFTLSRGFFVNLKTFRTQPILINA